MDYSATSFWLDTADDDLTPRPPLPGDIDVDVCVVGGGYTGLWTAYYLAARDPALRIAVVEAEICGYGASGRNGGWCSALFPTPLALMSRKHGRDATVAMHRAMQDTVDEVGRVAGAEGIDCHYAKGGTVVVARTPAQLRRAEKEVAAAREYGFGADDLALLGAAEASARCGADGVLGATYTPHCAAIHPARLVRGLARAVERRGVRIYERTRVTSLRPGRSRGLSRRSEVVTTHGVVHAAIVVRAVEGYGSQLPGYRRTVAPVYSLMLATEPLPTSFWDSVGLARRETFSDHRHLIIYGQRTADDRLAFGGRGAPYHFGSRIRTEYDCDARVHTELARVLGELFPALGPRVPVSHTWGGPLGIARDWSASVGLDRAAGMAWAGGYVGDGVGTSNLAGRTLADLIVGETTPLTTLPWVHHRSRRWEPEPLRWLGINAGLRIVTAADALETRSRSA